MIRRPVILAVAILLTLATAGLVTVAQRGPAPPRWPGQVTRGVTLLPNGWTIAPAGTHLFVGDLPLAMVHSPDQRYLFITNNGYSKPSLTIVDLKTQTITDRVSVEHAWLGLAWHPDGKRLYSSGGGENTIYEFAYTNGRIKQAGTFVLGRPERERGGVLEHAGFVSGLQVSPDGRTLYATQVFGKAVTAIDIRKSAIRTRVELDAEPYTCLLSPDGTKLYVSLWGGARVLVFDAKTLRQLAEIPAGEHPNAMVLSKDGARLFVACANTNAVWVLDLAKGTAREQVSIALYPNAPAGSTPNALSLSADGGMLLVANADNNTVAVVDVADAARSEVEGFIPTGWYPTAVAFDESRQQILVLSGKGLTSQANPRGPNAGTREAPGQYTGALLQGSLSLVPIPTGEQLKALTTRVYDVTPYRDAIRLAPADAPLASPIPKKVGDPSPIKYVFYIIRENRTYDQVLGDLEKGNGDPTLALLGEPVTPNAHAIVRDFVLLDNFYVDAEVSYDGHAYSTMAYANDFVEKIWPTNYGGRGGTYLSEGGGEMRNAYGNIAGPPEGYLWDFAKRAGVSVRSYGEFVREDEDGTMRATVPGLEGLVHPKFQPFDMDIRDNDRLQFWLEEFRRFEADGNLPRLTIMHLPDDHTAGTRPGAWTPRAMVAENDVALGRLVETISKSRYWKESAIFVLEDDAQNGPDHVDAHRSVALVISPFAKHAAVDSTMYSTSAMLRTIELILGLPPMSQYDAAATPMYNAFQPTPILTPYAARPARISIDERNGPDAPGAEASMRMNFDAPDRAPDLELNEIIWKSVHGRDAVMPPPVRAAWVRAVEEAEERGPKSR